LPGPEAVGIQPFGFHQRAAERACEPADQLIFFVRLDDRAAAFAT
jgi:hypothetical protein